MNLLLSLQLGEPSKSMWHITSGQDLILIILALIVLVGMALVGVVAMYLLLIIRKALIPAPVAEPVAVDPRSSWQRFAGLHTLSQEKDLVMEHAYDGILELDNPTPPWFMGLFYSTIGFAFVYLLLFHVLDVGSLQLAEYKQEVAIGERQRDAFIKKVAGSINENTVAFTKDEKSLDAGKALFMQNCLACHGQQGQGGVGPNLTDEFWIHGGSVKSIFRTINEGVVAKGMMSWKKQLNPLQVQQVSSFILSLQGTKPAGAKEPQGEKVAVN